MICSAALCSFCSARLWTLNFRLRFPQRCLYCPIAYHLSCIPPTSRFHELALLCHEHAGTRKLPYLDLESSVQSQVERAYAKKLEKEKESKIRAAKVGRKGNDGAINPFFPGVVGDSFVTLEDKVLAYLQKEEPDHEYLLDGIPFCLPCDIQDEVRFMVGVTGCYDSDWFAHGILLGHVLRLPPSHHPTGTCNRSSTMCPTGQSVSHRLTQSVSASRTVTNLASTEW